MTQFSKTGIVAIVVTYQPEIDILEQLLTMLESQVDTVVLVDNGSLPDLAIWHETTRPNSAVELLLLNENRGIAAAHNVGIEWAKNHQAQFVLLMDQDSIPAPGMVAKLSSAIAQLPHAAAAGPRYLDTRQENPPPFIRVRGLNLKRCTCATDEDVVPVDYLISSGCLIPMSVLDKVGGMRDDLFIDYVDIEWGLRARHHGFQSFGVCAAKMQHSLGEQPIKFLGKNFPLHSPVRHYYHFRNAVLLYKEQWIPGNWKIVDGWRLLLKYVFYTIFAHPRLTHYRMMTLGVWHGIRGTTGKFIEN